MSDPLDEREKTQEDPDRFQPKVLLFWSLLMVAVFALWFAHAPEGSHVQRWTVTRVLEAAAGGELRSGVIKADASGGPSWYIIEGEAMNTQPKAETPVAAAPGQRVLQGLKRSPVDQGPVIRFRAEGRLTDHRFEELTTAFSFREKPSSTLMMDVLMGLLPIGFIIFIVYFLFIRQLKMAGKGAMSFGKSKARLLTRDRKRVSFDDVAGCAEAKEEVYEIVEFLKDPKKFQKIGGRIPKGVLMVGAPGTGKTLLARAVASEADVPFFTISGSDFVEMFVGVGAARVRDMFEQGRANAPCLIFIDEIDAVGRQRGAGLGGGNDEREQTLNSILVEMDGFDGREGVIIIAATNRPDVLDSALLRPGRFDRQITIDLPDLLGREEILKVHAKKFKVEEFLDLGIVARNTPGFSGADLENLLNEGALIAARQDKDAISLVDLDEAREKISYGRERPRLMDEEDRRITAYHEAGHAVVAACIKDKNLPVHKVTIIPRGQSLGSTMFLPKKDILNHSKQGLLNQLCWSMGGRIAEELTFGDVTSGASGDIKMATKLARHMVCDWGMSELGPIAYGENQDHIFLGKEISRNQNYSPETAMRIDAQISAFVEAGYTRAKQLLELHKEALAKVAEALLQYETIEGRHVDEILEFGSMRSPVLDSPSRTASQNKRRDAAEAAEEKRRLKGAMGAHPAPSLA